MSVHVHIHAGYTLVLYIICERICISVVLRYFHTVAATVNKRIRSIKRKDACSRRIFQLLWFAKEKFDEELLQKQIVNERRQSTIRLEKRKMEIQRMKINNEKNLVDDGSDDK